MGFPGFNGARRCIDCGSHKVVMWREELYCSKCKDKMEKWLARNETEASMQTRCEYLFDDRLHPEAGSNRYQIDDAPQEYAYVEYATDTVSLLFNSVTLCVGLSMMFGGRKPSWVISRIFGSI